MPRQISVVRDHGVRVWILSESQRGAPVYAHVGDRRWECEWHELTPAARKRYDSDPNYEHDHDADERSCVSAHPSKEAAIAAAKKVAGGSVYGCAVVQQHEVVQDEYYQAAAEWEPIGPAFEVTGNGEVSRL
jgi:hypothetical protein